MSAEPVSNFVDTRLERLVVVDLLIVADIGCLSLVADLLQSLLALQTIDATAMGRYVDGIGSAETAKVFLLEKVAHTYPSAQAEITEIHVDLTLCIRWIVDHKHTVGTLRPVDITRKHIAIVDIVHYIGLLADGILVDGNEITVGQELQSVVLDACHIAADEQRRVHRTPHTEVRLILFCRHAASHLKHIHVVVVPTMAVCGQRQVLPNDASHRFPGIGDVGGRTPRGSHVAHPRAWIVPPAHVEPHLAPGILDGLADGRIAFLLAEPEAFAVLSGIATAEVDLDEVEVQIFEEVVTVLLVVLIESRSVLLFLPAVVSGAGVVSGIGVDARLQSEPVDIVHHGFQSAWETVLVDDELSRGLVTTTLEAIVDIDVGISRSLQALVGHSLGLALDERRVDLGSKCVPRAPSHGGAVVQSLCHGGSGKGCHSGE